MLWQIYVFLSMIAWYSLFKCIEYKKDPDVEKSGLLEGLTVGLFMALAILSTSLQTVGFNGATPVLHLQEEIGLVWFNFAMAMIPFAMLFNKI